MNQRPRPYWRSIRTYWYWFAVVFLLLAQWYLTPPVAGPPLPPAGHAVLEEGIYRIRRVVDGDTLRLESGERVRLQGIDTPETVRENFPVERWGPEASAFTKEFVQRAGMRVRLTFGNDRIDSFGRYLAFVWDGDRLLNEELVREGLAETRLRDSFASDLKRRLRLAEEDARKHRRGIWSDSDGVVGRRRAGSRAP